MTAPAWIIPLLITVLAFFIAWKYPPAEGEYSGLRRLGFLVYAIGVTVIVWAAYAVIC